MLCRLLALYCSSRGVEVHFIFVLVGMNGDELVLIVNWDTSRWHKGLGNAVPGINTGVRWTRWSIGFYRGGGCPYERGIRSDTMQRRKKRWKCRSILCLRVSPPMHAIV